LVLHGRRRHQRVVAAVHDLALKIPGATVEMIPGMGHDLPQELLERFADSIAANAQRS
ncbi:alpha/beta hydrolase, partial [Rubrivivax gelatinosus]|nr:alpha/beta hydrolase [Rubrivivax gelatinosus]